MSSHSQVPSDLLPSTPVRQRSSVVNLSPRTPASISSTPYTTLSPSDLSSPPSSTLTTPSSVKFSPISTLHSKSNKSIADLTENWRVRAQLNGIKVSAIEDNGEPKKDRYTFTSRVTSIDSLPICLVFRSPKVSLLPPAFTTGFSRKSSASGTSSLVTSRSVLQPLKTGDIKYTLGAFNSQFRRLARCDSTSDSSEGDESDDCPKIDAPKIQNMSSFDKSLQPPSHSSCSVCDKKPAGVSRMIVLSPCSHVFCSSCFTGILNIVGEKTMSCMECNSPIEDFRFALPNISHSDIIPSPIASPGDLFQEFVDVPSVSRSGSASYQLDQLDKTAILRIDNVPWDVTPLVIKSFIKHPIVRAYVLLDAKGKTLSHAFVQLSLDSARAALRSSQNAILGQGRRARAVTVTLSSPAELMAALYPHWRGNFESFQPSLDGLDNQQVNEALQRGLMSNVEINSLFNLITTPDSHFLKVPSLPYWSLINILSTFPADSDSRVFWSLQLRDALFRVTHGALGILASRKKTEENTELWRQLVAVSTSCRAFTTLQKLKLQLLIDETLVANLKVSVAPVSNLSLDSPERLKRFEMLTKQLRLEPSVLAAIIKSFA